MKKIIFGLLALCAFNTRAEKIDSAAIRAYVQQYKDIAVAEMKRSGIPASITLAQGIHESGSGKSYLAQNTNNHFGIKCHENWTGKTFQYTDDSPNECFRAYDSPEQSFKDHSDFLSKRPRYQDLFALNKDDYKGWAYGLKKDGYATNPRYPEILIKTIEDFHLDLLDKGETPDYISTPVASEKTPEPEFEGVDASTNANTETPKAVSDEPINQEVPIVDPEKSAPVTAAQIVATPTEQKIIRVNGRKAVMLANNETAQLIGGILQISNEDLMAFNDVTGLSSLKEGNLMFLQRKRMRNPEGRYTVQEGDNMWLISQNKGIRLDKLYQRNRMVTGEEAAVNETLYLKGTVKVKPKLRTNEIVKETITTPPVADAEPVKTPVLPKEAAKDNVPEASRPDFDMSAPKQNDPVATTTTTPVNTTPDTDKLTADNSKSPTVNNTPAPEPAKTIYPAVIDYAKLPKSTNGMHTVIKGDTMYNIAKRYNISLQQLMAWNNLSDQNIKLGQVLKIQP